MRSFTFIASLAAVGLAIAGLAGCTTVSGFPAPSTVGTSAAAATSRAVPKDAISTAPAAAPVSPRLRTGAAAAAAQAFGLYASGQFAALWSLLSPATKRHVTENAWVSVHRACQSGAAEPGTVKAVTVFGNAAIVTEAVAGTPPHTIEVVFNDVNGRWSYSPEDPSVYGHRSVAADIAAAKSAGLCDSWKIF
jgi:hypothetical protein